MKLKKSSFIILSLMAIVLFSGCIDTSPEEEETILTVIGVSGETKTFNMTSLLSLPSIRGKSEYQNTLGNWRDKGTYQGVLISILADEVGGIQTGDLLIVSTRDNYTPQIFTYDNIIPPTTKWNNTQGSMILAYKFNDILYPNWEDGPRIAFLPLDEGYSNNDKGNTSSLEALRGSAGTRWSKYVNKLEFRRESERVTIEADMKNYTFSWTQVLNFPSITSAGGFITKTGMITGPFDYTGVNLSYVFNTLIDTSFNFSIEIVASDGYRRTFIKEEVFGSVPVYNSAGEFIGHGGRNNLSLILAYKNDSSPLIEGSGPFMIAFVSPDSFLTDSWRWIRDVVFIRITYT
ncbi:MAG: hypothetical protein ACFFAM_07920 [Promethearchaeota archaeon]